MTILRNAANQMTLHKFIGMAFLAGICHLAVIFHVLSNQHTRDAAFIEGYSKGVSFQMEIQKALDKPKKFEESLDVTNDWQEILFFDGRKFFFTDKATPKPMEEAMNYFWTGRGCYAFAPDSFSYEEVFEVFLRKPVPKPVPQAEQFGGKSKFL